MSIRKLQIILLEILILLMPYHYLFFAVLLDGIPGLKLWRDALMLLIIVLGIIHQGGFRRDSSLVVDLLFIALNVVYIALAPNTFQALNITRVYLLPILMFHTVKNMELTAEEISSFMKRLMISAAICCIYGIVQAYLLGPSFLVKLGYSNTNGMLSPSFYLSNYGGGILGRTVQRVVSTFSSANVCAFYLGCVFVLFLSARDAVKVRSSAYYAFMFLVFATIILTFSRSVWLAIAIAVIAVNIRQLWAFILKGRRIIICIGVVVIGIIVASDSLRNALVHVVKSSLSGSDTSVLSHMSTLNSAAELVISNPFGLGLGENGPRALNYGASNLVESSYFLMMFEYGIIGAAVYFFDYFFVAANAIMHYGRFKKTSTLSLCLVIFALAAYFNIPYVQEIECTGLILVLLGLFCAKGSTPPSIALAIENR